MRRHIPTLSLLGTLILLPACGTTPTPAPAAATEPVTGLDLELTVEVIQLQHADARATADVVNDLICSATGTAPESPRVIADERLNALVVYGDAVERDHIRDLLTALDKPDRH